MRGMGVGQLAAYNAMHKNKQHRGGRPPMRGMGGGNHFLMNLAEEHPHHKHHHHHHHHHAHQSEQEKHQAKHSAPCTGPSNQPGDKCYCFPGDQFMKPWCKVASFWSTPAVCTKERVQDPLDLECQCYPGDEFNAMKSYCVGFNQWRFKRVNQFTK